MAVWNPSMNLKAKDQLVNDYAYAWCKYSYMDHVLDMDGKIMVCK